MFNLKHAAMQAIFMCKVRVIIPNGVEFADS